ncbi:MAG: hypothetical protein HFI05_15500 [Lachnospiraceae bacterium]|jgi:hypothetical protein|nr:hypothetical protein [Lachnospiraceae bacterium]
MVACKVIDIKGFMAKLLLKEIFDEFLVIEAEISTDIRFSIDGHIQEEFFTIEEREELPKERIALWKRLRPICFELIKGKKTPKNMKIVFRMKQEMVRSLLQETGLPYREEDIEGLYLHIRYEKESLYCITGVSMRIFTMEKGLEHSWDKKVQEFLKTSEIFYEME